MNTKINTEKYAKTYIKNWILENNPAISDNQIAESIYLEVQEQLVDLEQGAIRIVLSQYLAIHHSNEYKDVVDSVLDHKYSDAIKDWKDLGIYNSEVGCILRNIERAIISLDNIGSSKEDVIQKVINDHIMGV